MTKRLPTLTTDEAAKDFIANADLTRFDLSGLTRIQFEFQPKDERVDMRLPRPLLDAVKEIASQQGMPYQRFIRQVLEDAVRRHRS